MLAMAASCGAAFFKATSFTLGNRTRKGYANARFDHIRIIKPE
jgi:hypothetical protein